MKKTYIINNAPILSMDAKKTFYPNHALVIKDGRIAAIMPDGEAAAAYPEAELFDGSGMVVMPGLINTHMHSNLVRGFGDDMELYAWHEAIAETVGMAVTPDQAYTGALISYCEAIKSGTTTILCMEKYSEKCYQAALESGIRARIVPYVLDFDDCVDTVELNLAYVLRTIDPDERVKFWFGFDSFREAGEDLIRRVVALSNEYRLGMQTHSNESVDDVALCRKMHGMDPIEYLDSLGVIGERTVLAHCVHLSEKEREIMQNRGARLSHCCVSNMKLCDGAAPICDYMERGIGVGLGTDGANSNNNYDLFEEMKSAILLQRIVQKKADALKAVHALRMATLGGAEVLGLDEEIGSLEVGKRADVILVNMKNLHSLPLTREYPSVLESNLVYACNGSDVDTVFVDGELVMCHRELLTINEQAVVEQANAEGLELLAKLAAKGVKM